jgi:hypothetical protein
MGRALAVCVCIAVAFAMSDEVRPPLTNDDVISLFKAGWGEPVLLKAITISRRHFDLSPGALASLRKEGLSETVIAAMRSGRTPTPHLRLLEPGVYVKRGDVYALVEPEAITWQGQSAEEAAGQVTRSTFVGRVDARNTHLSLTAPAELLFVSADSEPAAQYHLLRAEVKEDYREFRVEALCKGGVLLALSGKSAVPAVLDDTFDLGVRVLLGSLHRGEYGVVPLGGRFSPDGRIYTFSIE